MKTRDILIMAICVIALHSLVLFLFFASGSSGEKTDNAAVRGRNAGQPRTEEPRHVQNDKDTGVQEPEAITVPPRVLNNPWNENAKLYTGPGRKFIKDAGTLTGTVKGLNGSSDVRAGILVDLTNGRILWQKNPDKQVPIASLSKLMTNILVYERLLTADDFLPETVVKVTSEAAGVPPSGVALKTGESFTVEKLLTAAAVKSANDATYLLAQECAGGSADNFVKKMNERAVELGMTQTTFYNPHGLPGKSGKFDNKSTMNDMLKLCEAYLTYPKLVQLSGQLYGSFRKKNDLKSPDHLLPKGSMATPGVFGLKTGFTNRAGFCLATICKRDGRTLLAVVTGFKTSKERDVFVRDLLDWGYKR